MKIGFIGMGIMGSRMAANLLKKGYELVVYNRTKEKAEPLLAQGAHWADSPADVGKRTHVVFTMLSRPDAVAETALLGRHSFLDAMHKGSLWVDCSTVNPSFSKLLAGESAARSIRFLDAPVGGSKMPAETGQLVFFVGGNKADLDSVRTLFESMGRSVHHMGGNGMGSAMKMVNNIILGSAMAVFAEAIAFGESLGITRHSLFDTLAGSPVVAPFLHLKRQKLVDELYDADFPLQLMHKDLHLAIETAYETGAVLPTTGAVKELYALAASMGLAAQDFSAVHSLVSGHKRI